MEKIIIIPDVHGRTFWKNAVKDNEDKKIIFLGDYLDPYPHEWEGVENYKELAIENFKEIIEFKKQHMENVILLLGNHDCEYMYSISVCECRMDYKNAPIIKTLFRDNKELFQIAYEEYINEKHFIFSHAGIETEWINSGFINNVLTNYNIKDINESNMVELLNKFNQDALNSEEIEKTKFCSALEVLDFYRGGWGHFGSVVWADARAFSESIDKMGYQIFGHTQLENKPYICDEFALLDVRKAFYINENSEIKEL